MLDPAEIDRLKQFHTAHFPHEPTPKLANHSEKQRQTTTSVAPDGDCDELGFYEDGTKRTLTDAQIKMFRHSEIQRLFNERRAAQKTEKKRQKRPHAGYRHQAVAAEGNRQFDDAFPKQDREIDTLMYDDDESISQANSQTTPRSFLWPKLG